MRPLLLPLLALTAAPLCAQRSGLGVKGGLLACETRTGAVSTRMIPGGSAGAYFALRAAPRMELQPELLITALGSGYTLPDGDRSTVRTLYVQVPLSVKLYVGNAFNVQGGFQMGRLLLAQQHGPEGDADVTPGYKSWDQGLILGAGVDLVSGLDLGLRYYNGLSTILADDQAIFPRNRSLMLSAGYRITGMRTPKLTRKRR